MTRRAYAFHELLVAPARPRPELWRLLAGLAAIMAVSFGLNALLFAVLVPAISPAWGATLPQGGTPGQMTVLLGGFAFVTLGVALVARWLHDRPALGILGPLPLALGQFWAVFRMLLLLCAALLLLPPYDMGLPLRPNLSPGHWIGLLPLSLALVLIQTSAEEILFRGYIQQSLAARFSSPLAWMVLPSALFALGHFAPAQAGDNAPLIMLWAGVFGLMMADLTARSGTLGPAIAVHFVNNIIALVIVGAPEGLNGLSLYILPYEMSDTGLMREWLAVDFAMMAVTWLAARLALRR